MFSVDGRPGEGAALLTPAEVAQAFRVDPKTVTRWARAGRLSSVRTPGGHRRFRATEVKTALGGGAPVDVDGDRVRVLLEGALERGRHDGTQAHIPATEWSPHMWLSDPTVRLIATDADDGEAVEGAL